MVRPFFPDLLNNVLHGDYSALKEWRASVRDNDFLQEEIDLIIKAVNKLSVDDSPRKSDALFLRAYLHEKGLGVVQSYSEAIRLYDEAIALGNPSAMSHRAYMHQKGIGGSINYSEAIRLYEAAIALGNPEALEKRLYMYEHSLGGPRNQSEMIRLLRKRQLYKAACYRLLDEANRLVEPLMTAQTRLLAATKEKLDFEATRLQNYFAVAPNQYAKSIEIEASRLASLCFCLIAEKNREAAIDEEIAILSVEVDTLREQFTTAIDEYKQHRKNGLCQYHVEPDTDTDFSYCHGITMLVFGGFAVALGISALALGLVALDMLLLIGGAAALVTGISLASSGLGLFPTAKNRIPETVESVALMQPQA